MRTTPKTRQQPKKDPEEILQIPQDARWSWLIVSLCVFVVSLAVLWWNAAPGISFHDSGEFAIAAASGGIPHPPGAPTWTILATLFVKLGGFRDAARGANLYSGLWGAITLGILCWLAQLWAYILFRSLPKWAHVTAGICAVLVMLHSSGFLEQSFIAEQYTQMVALMMMVVVAATLLVLSTPTPQPKTRLCYTMGLMWGLAIGNHLSQIALGLLVAWAMWAASSREKRFRDFTRLSGICALGLATGLLVFLWLPIRSHANPIIDSGNVKTLDRFIWAITRKQWATRPISTAPPNLVPEWILSYDLARQTGVLGLLLVVPGVLTLVRKQRMWLGWLAAISVPYGAGMLFAHLHQKSIDASYIVSYGVTDWHLPIYLALAMSASIGICALIARMLNSKVRAASAVVMAAIVCILAVTAGLSVKHTSLRHYTAPEQFIRDILAPLPPHPLIMGRGDNVTSMLAYKAYVADRKAEIWVVRDALNIDRFMAEAERNGVSPEAAKLGHLRQVIADVEDLTLRVPQPEIGNTGDIRVYCDFAPLHPKEAYYLLPDGYLFEFAGRRVSDAEVVAAEQRWRERCPNLFRNPPPDAYRLDRDAYAGLHESRGVYFATRKMWKQSADAYKMSLKWIGNNGVVWFYLADALDHMGRVPEAVEAYKQAIWRIPAYSAPKYNLAMIYARSGYYEAAQELLVEALATSPNDTDIQRKLARVREKIR